MKTPERIPEKGFYYHYKHDPKGPVNNHAYEVTGVGCHTEEDCRPEDANMVIYRPLYEEAPVYKAGKLSDLKPLDMFMGEVIKDGTSVPRFRKVDDTDFETIAKLGAAKVRMYS